jgi:hypothetical protein
MAFVLADAQKLSDSKLTNFVINEFRKSRILEMIPFDDTVKPQGGQTLAYIYNRVTTLATAAGRAINVEYIAQEAKTTPITVALKIFGGSANLDRVIINNEQQVVKHIPFQLEQKSEATRALFCDQFINGDSGEDPLEFDGLAAALVGSSTEVTPLAPIDLSSSTNITTNFNLFMDTLDAWLSTLDKTPSALLMNKTLKAIMSGCARRSGYFSTSDVDAFGKPVTKYQGIPIEEVGDKPGTSNPIIATTDSKTDLYAVRFGLDGVHAVSPEGADVIKIYLPNMTLPGAVKTVEVEMVAAVAIKSTRSAGVLHDIKVA